MRIVLQRAENASVTVARQMVGQIQHGFVLLVGVTHEDTEEDVAYLVNKIIHLRIFEDDENRMNRSLLDVGGSVLSISQFTLYGDTRKGRRPSFINAAPPDHALELYNRFNQMLEEKGIHVETGEFGEMMDVTFTNKGPATFILESEEKK
ncbi:D-aminoacyl-tRNA deacylase [Virgibacillus sp. W0430]|uniref:D-aminoacyl-tRNA deacylase n=1 Tax=Virgibacillus sp. W0430 TaxID=3391580 RepID=UPI003F48FE1D